MLLGVRGDLRRKLAKQGHRTRVYLPYGSKWYEYGVRRLRENPDVAWHITKALLFPWSNRRYTSFLSVVCVVQEEDGGKGV